MTTAAPQQDHHDPVGRTDYLSCEHVERYRFAASRLGTGSRTLRVLDVASGTGYGTAALRSLGHKVTGVDLEPESIGLAQRRYGSKGWVVADGRSLPFADATFDCVVSFETVEHVVDGRAFLAELRRVLRPGGKLICSTPNIRYTAHPPCHLKEYEPGEFFDLVAALFEDLQCYGQYFRKRDRLRDLYSWHWQADVLRVADKIGLRQAWRKLSGKPALGAVAQAVAHDGPLTPQSPLQGRSDPVHLVQKIQSEEMLRIMVAVATKGRDS